MKVGKLGKWAIKWFVLFEHKFPSQGDIHFTYKNNLWEIFKYSIHFGDSSLHSLRHTLINGGSWGLPDFSEHEAWIPSMHRQVPGPGGGSALFMDWSLSTRSQAFSHRMACKMVHKLSPVRTWSQQHCPSTWVWGRPQCSSVDSPWEQTELDTQHLLCHLWDWAPEE